MSNSSILTYLTQAQIRDSVQLVIGEIATRPALSKTDGTNLTWVADVRIPTQDPTGMADWNASGHRWDPVAPTGTNINSVLRLLRDVPITTTNRDLNYADVGTAVELTRNACGKLEVTGFSKRKPGTHTRTAVDLTTRVPEATVSYSYTTRLLTFGEIGDPAFGGFGVTPFGAYGVFIGGTLVEVRS